MPDQIPVEFDEQYVGFGAEDVTYGIPNTGTGGYLLPDDPQIVFQGLPLTFGGQELGLGSTVDLGQVAHQAEPEDDDPLDDILQGVIRGITGLRGELVRPRWQPEAPNTPEFAINWCAFGVTAVDSPPWAYVGHVHKAGPLVDVDREITFGGDDVDFGRNDLVISEQQAGADTEFDYVSRWEELSVLVSFYGPQARRFARRLMDGLQIRQNLEPMRMAQVFIAHIGGLIHTGDLVKNRWVHRIDLPLTFRRSTIRTYSVLHLLSADGVIHTDEQGSRPKVQAIEFNGKPIEFDGVDMSFTELVTGPYQVSFKA